jgi:hypothetical protein
MKNETVIRGLLVLSLITLSITLFFFLENQRQFDEYKVTTKKETDSLIETQFLLTNEIGVEELVLDSLFRKYPKLQKEHDYIKNESNLFE